MTNINLNLYKIFCVVATSKSYSEASEKINQTVANISTQISNLESQLDTKLFDREKDGVKLTEQGRILYDTISKSMLAFDYGEKILKEKSDLTNGTITIGCPSHLTLYYLMDCIEKARQDYPGLNIRIVSNVNTYEMVDVLKQNKVDFIIIDMMPKISSEVVVEELKTINNILVSKSPLKITNLKELENLKYILNFDYANSTKVLVELLRKYNVEIKRPLECDVTEIRADAAKRGFGIGYLIKDAVKKELENGELFEVELPIELPSIGINLIYMKDKLTKVDKSFINKYLK